MELFVLADTGMPGVYQPKAITQNQAAFFESAPRSDAGVTVSASTADTLSSVWQAKQIISGDVARVALNLYYRGRNDERLKRSDLPSWGLLNRSASMFMSAYTLRETMQAQALIQGNAYAWIQRTSTAAPLSLVLLDPTQTVPHITKDGELVYQSKQYKQEIPAGDVLHLRGLGGDGISGQSVVTLARTSWGLAIAGERHGASTFKNGARPSVVLTHTQRLDKPTADQLIDQFASRHAGADNSGRPALAAGGLGITTLPVSNEDAQWLQSRAFQRVEIASWFCLPPHKLGDSSRVGYNSVEAEERSYVSQTLMRWFVRWQCECNEKLLTEKEKAAGAYWEHNADALIQGDFATQTTMLTNLRINKIITQNEARQKLNMPSVPGGDTFENPATSSGAMAPVAAMRTDPLRALLVDRVEHLVRTEAAQLANTAKAKNVAKSIESLYEAFEPKMAKALSPILNVIEAAGLKAPSAESLAATHCDSSKTMVLERLTDSGTPADMLKAELSELSKDWHETRVAEMVAIVFGGEE